MGFNFYFASMDDKRTMPYFYEKGFKLLYSQINNRTSLNKTLEVPKDKRGGLLVDSGAHSAHTKGIELDLDEYISYVNANIDNIDYYVQVDKIPGKYLKPKTMQDFIEAPMLSWENYKYMREQSKDCDKLIPVFHQGEDLKWLSNMLEARFDGEPIKYIGLSPRGDVAAMDKYLFCAQCFEVIQNSSNPEVKTHAFGMTSLKLLEKLPFYSADSTTYLHVAAYGQVWTPYGKIGISKENIAHSTSNLNYYHMDKKQRKKLEDYFDSIGFTVEELAESHVPRTKASALYCQNWADNYVYSGLKSFKTTKRLF